MDNSKGVIYYTDNRVIEPIFSTAQKFIKESNLPITCVSLKPTDFGDTRIVLPLVRSYPTMVRQIITALENSKEKFVFFCENDVLYHKSHFDFTPPKDNVFYYDDNIWRWRLWDDKAIRYEGMLPLSALCVGREFALAHFKMREEKICKHLDEFRSREPRLSRIWGYEPGCKKVRNGGLTDDVRETYSATLPSIDIRHKRTFSAPKVKIEDFKHVPGNWQEISIAELPGWNLKEIFPNNIE
jgi:hypothetical protein